MAGGNTAQLSPACPRLLLLHGHCQPSLGFQFTSAALLSAFASPLIPQAIILHQLIWDSAIALGCSSHPRHPSWPFAPPEEPHWDSRGNASCFSSGAG